MLSIVSSCAYRFGCRLGRFQREHLAGKPLAVLLVVAGVTCSVVLNARLPVSGHLLVWILLLPFIAWLVRRDGQPFFGPVFFYDLVRSSHRGEQVGHRCLYAILLICVLAGVYWSWFPNLGIEHLMRSRSMTVSQRARLAGSFFTSFMTAQFAIVFLITPLYTASAIAEQKERRTLDFLLLTDLSNREIVLGMLGARLAKLLLLMMTGLPVLSLLEFLGGVDPDLVLAGFVATCMLMASLGSVSILASVHARTALGAVIVSYLVTLLLFVIAFLPFLPAAQAFFVVTNPGLAGRPSPSPPDLSTSLIAFSFIHGLIAILCCRSAIAHVRRAALAQKGDTGGTSGATTRPAVPRRRGPYDVTPSEVTYGAWGPYYPVARDSDPDSRRWRDPYSLPRRARPRVGADALLWKEIHAESAFGLGALRQLPFGPALAVLALLVFVIASANVQDWVQRLEIVLSSVLLLIVALSASGRVSRERERRTLDNVLTLPVSRSAIHLERGLALVPARSDLGCGST
jgi:ABC-type transport system involved in multi-copper enzyme maturation permease subunit